MRVFLLIGFIVSQNIFAAETTIKARPVETSERTAKFKSLSLGHLLTSNNRTFAAGQVSLGTLYAGVGITDNLTVVTSPFVYVSYKMHNIIGRLTFDLSDSEKLGFDGAYFKTFGALEQTVTNSNCNVVVANGMRTTTCQKTYGVSGFKMEAASAKVTYSNAISSDYKFNSTLSYFYYYDDERPFSFRMDPANNDRYALNLSTLHEFKVSDPFYVNVEAGLWGLNYKYRYYHTGLTLNYQVDNILVGVGASTTFSPSFPKDKVKEFPSGYDSRFAIHPEIQIQAFL